jgi:hypothetical protein
MTAARRPRVGGSSITRLMHADARGTAGAEAPHKC